MSGPPPVPEVGFRALAGAILTFAGRRAVSTVLIVALAAVLEGAGIVLLLPVAETIFAQSEGAVQTGITASITARLADIGIDTVFEQLAVMGSAFVALAALRAFVLLRRDVLLSELSQGFVDHERRRFFAILAHAEWPVIKRYRKSQLLNTMTTNIGRLAQTMNFLSRGIVTVALGLASLGAAFLISLTLGLLLLALTAAGLLFAVIWSRRSHASGEQLSRAHGGVMRETTRFLDGLKAAKAARAEDEFTASFASSIAATRRIQVAFVRQQARLRNGIQLLAAIAALLVLLVGFGLLGLSGGELLVMAAIILRLAPSLVTTFSGIQSVAHALPAFSAIRTLETELAAAHTALDIPAETASPPLEQPAADASLEIANCRVEAVAEDGRQVVLVDSGRITLSPGMLVHIGGASGAGKSTLAELIAGLYLPASGSIAFGSLSLAPATRRHWQSLVSFAPQEPFLFDGTIRQNLCWPDLEPEDETIWRALAEAEAEQLVRELPAGLDEELLDGGARLSGGERQRLCIARALLRPARLLVLDEATSAMDPVLERGIVETLKRSAAQRIVVLVSHSRNAVDLVDRRIEVADGKARVVE